MRCLYHAGVDRSKAPIRSGVPERKEVTMLRSILAVVLVGILALTVATPDAFAEERVCRGSIGATTVDNLRVPSGSTCKLNGTRVEGTLKVERSAKLFASGVRVV